MVWAIEKCGILWESKDYSINNFLIIIPGAIRPCGAVKNTWVGPSKGRRSMQGRAKVEPMEGTRVFELGRRENQPTNQNLPLPCLFEVSTLLEVWKVRCMSIAGIYLRIKINQLVFFWFTETDACLNVEIMAEAFIEGDFCGRKVPLEARIRQDSRNVARQERRRQLIETCMSIEVDKRS